MSRRQAQDFAHDTSPENRSTHGAIRRMAIRLTRTVLWQLAGYRNADKTGETVDAEPFTGIGFYARPKASDKAEAVLVQVGDSRHTVVVACRNEEARRAVVNALNGGSGLAEDETCVYCRAALMHFKSDGTMEARTPGGLAKLLALHQDMIDLKTAFSNWVVVPMDGGGALKTLLTSLIGTGWPHGTSKFKAE